MAAATTTASSSLCNNLSFPHSPNPTHTHTHFPSKPKPLQPLNLKTHLYNFPPLPLISLPHFHRAVASFDDLEIEKESQSTEQQDPEAEFSENQEEEEEEEEGEEEGEQQKVFGSNEERRLYVGNLPYSMTSAQLAEIFEQAGHVVSVEVCDSLNLLVSLSVIIFSNVILGCLLAVLDFI